MLKLDNLTRDYGKFRAVDHLSLEIGTGELHGFVGPNGAGKSTTMRMLATLLAPTSGKAYVNGVEISKSPSKIRRMVGYMPDFFGVYDGLKSWEYLDFYARCYHIPAKERDRMIDQLLELVNLSDKKFAYVDELSRGMKQRLCLAHSLIHDPKLLILDEPASGMDPRARAEMKGILKTLKEMGEDRAHFLAHSARAFGNVRFADDYRPWQAGVLRLGGRAGQEDERQRADRHCVLRRG